MDYIIATSNLTKSYKEKVVVDKVNLHVKKGEIYGFVGPNGAGKSTIMKMLLNLVRPDSGEIYIFGEKMDDKNYDTEFAKEHLPGYETVIGVHVDKEHIHAHLVFNSVNADTGEKYHSNAQSYYQQIRATSDRLCREHGLSVIMEGESAQAVSYIEWLRHVYWLAPLRMVARCAPSLPF